MSQKSTTQGEKDAASRERVASGSRFSKKNSLNHLTQTEIRAIIRPLERRIGLKNSVAIGVVWIVWGFFFWCVLTGF